MFEKPPTTRPVASVAAARQDRGGKRFARTTNATNNYCGQTANGLLLAILLLYYYFTGRRRGRDKKPIGTVYSGV